MARPDGNRYLEEVLQLLTVENTHSHTASLEGGSWSFLISYQLLQRKTESPSSNFCLDSRVPAGASEDPLRRLHVCSQVCSEVSINLFVKIFPLKPSFAGLLPLTHWCGVHEAVVMRKFYSLGDHQGQTLQVLFPTDNFHKYPKTHLNIYFFLFKNIDLFFRWLLSIYMTVAVELHEGFCFVEVTVRVQGGADITQLQHQCGENPVARLQPTTGVISHIFTTRSVPQVTISPLAMSMDIWEMLCFPS